MAYYYLFSRIGEKTGENLAGYTQKSPGFGQSVVKLSAPQRPIDKDGINKVHSTVPRFPPLDIIEHPLPIHENLGDFCVRGCPIMLTSSGH